LNAKLKRGLRVVFVGVLRLLVSAISGGGGGVGVVVVRKRL